MFDSIHIGTSGLQAFSAGLKVISNNVANLNTPGFKSADAQFANLFYINGGTGAAAFSGNSLLFGSGVMAGQTFVNFKAGETRQTGNALDLSVTGEGFFITRQDGSGDATYTRAGQFEFNDKGVLVVRGTDRQVVGLGAGNTETALSLDGLRINPPTPTATVSLAGNISSGATDLTVDSMKVIDAVGGEHVLKLNFKPKTDTPGTWTVTVLDGTAEVGSGEIAFLGGRPVAGSDSFSFNYVPAGVDGADVKVDFSKNVTSFDTGTVSSLAVSSGDGKAVGSLTKVAFEADGTMALTYSNGEVVKSTRLALARFDTPALLTPLGENGFSYARREGLHIGAANADGFGAIASNQVEGSNVDLATEFSDLIVAQRGYQASSRIVSTANEMLQDLYDMKGVR
jgi:flagellar hook protein FlgE